MAKNRIKLKDKFKTEHYKVAFYSLTHGDYVEFIEDKDSDKASIFLADACGHEPGFGNSVSYFVEEQTSKGWGFEGSPKEELEKLSEVLPSRDGSWSELLCCQYAQIDGKKIKISSAGMPNPIRVNSFGNVDEVYAKGAILDFYTLHQKEEEAEIELHDDEVLFLYTDGIHDNIDFKNSETDDPYVYNSLECILRDNAHKGASEIRSNLMQQLGQMIYQTGPEYDDFSFVVVTKRR